MLAAPDFLNASSFSNSETKFANEFSMLAGSIGGSTLLLVLVSTAISRGASILSVLRFISSATFCLNSSLKKDCFPSVPVTLRKFPSFLLTHSCKVVYWTLCTSA